MHCSCASSSTRSNWRRRLVSAPLSPPPDLFEYASSQEHAAPPATSDKEKLDNLFGKNKKDGTVGTVKHQKSVGNVGSKTRDRAHLYHTLAVGGSTPQENLDATLMRLVYGLCFLLWSEYGERVVCDSRWCGAFAAAAKHVARTTALPNRKPAVCVMGLGSGVLPLTAAKSGCDVMWIERVARFVEVANSLAKRNGVERIRVMRAKQWTDFAPAADSSFRFDAVMTEEVSDDLFGDGLLTIARHAHTHLLRQPGGRFIPARARCYGALASLRIEEISGFDLSAFNAFRSNDSVFIDLEHVWATDLFRKQHAVLLSEPVHLFDCDFSSIDSLPPPSREVELLATASADGVLNCLTWWFVLELDDDDDGTTPSALTLDLGPNEAKPIDFGFRARRQKVRYLSYERRLHKGEHIRLRASHDEKTLVLDAPVDGDAEADAARCGRIVQWPRVNALAYHFPMIADEGRNGAFDRALISAVTRFKRENNGKGPRVLDIGSGSGLLAMMAARAGASEVHSLEMVPSLAAVARHIVASNGYGDKVSIHGVMSTDLDPSTVGGLFDLLVCEIVDDQLLGEGVLTTIDDARRRLLTSNPMIIPSGAQVFTQALELRVGTVEGCALDDLNLFSTDSTLAPKGHTGCKLQRVPPSLHKRLSKPIELFSFDFAKGDLRRYLAGRTRDDLTCNIEAGGGILSGFLIHFNLKLDVDPRNDFASGPSNTELVAWDQSLRVIPVELRVRGGERLQLRVEHDHEAVRVGLPGIHPSMMQDMVGHTELVAMPGQQQQHPVR